jgi:cytoskeletal protein CcmA (bactofilin family)
VARNLYGFGRDIDVAAGSDVGGNAITFGENIAVAGRVGIDLKSFGSNVAVSGNVQGDVEAFARDVTLLPSARVGGNLTVHMDEPNDLQIASGAIVSGSVDRQVVEREQRRNQYLTVGFYVRQVVRLGAAFLTGLLLFWLFPTLRTLSLPDGAAALRTAGIGLVTAVTLPVAALLVCLTIVGLPIGIAAFASAPSAACQDRGGAAIGRRLFSGRWARRTTGRPARGQHVMIAINLPGRQGRHPR